MQVATQALRAGTGTHPGQLLLKLANAGPSGYIFAGTLAGTDPHSCSLPERMQGAHVRSPHPLQQALHPAWLRKYELSLLRVGQHRQFVVKNQCGGRFWCVHQRCAGASAVPACVGATWAALLGCHGGGRVGEQGGAHRPARAGTRLPGGQSSSPRRAGCCRPAGCCGS
jgi:hypothetical protein